MNTNKNNVLLWILLLVLLTFTLTSCNNNHESTSSFYDAMISLNSLGQYFDNKSEEKYFTHESNSFIDNSVDKQKEWKFEEQAYELQYHESVSYTHLDVYKRQVYSKPSSRA